MPKITITLEDTPEHTVSCHSTFVPAVGHPLTPAQMAAMEIMLRTNREWGIKGTLAKSCGVDIDAIHTRRDHMAGAV